MSPVLVSVNALARLVVVTCDLAAKTNDELVRRLVAAIRGLPFLLLLLQLTATSTTADTDLYGVFFVNVTRSLPLLLSLREGGRE